MLGESQEERQSKRTYCLAHYRNLSLSLSVSLSLLLPLSMPFFIVQLFCRTIHLIVGNLKLLSIRKLHCEWVGGRVPEPRGQLDAQRAHNMSHSALYTVTRAPAMRLPVISIHQKKSRERYLSLSAIATVGARVWR